MIDVFRYYARCNRIINAQMADIMAGAEIDGFNHPVDAYYKSAGEILNHCCIADMSWLSSFKSVRDFRIFNDPVFEKIPAFGEILFTSIEEFRNYRDRLDGIILALTDEIEPDDLQKTNTRISRKGIRVEKAFWMALMHMFNHQTHHRGQVSQILDQLHIENDYSNMILIP